MDGPIASAVVLPEQDLEPIASPPHSHKRRQSSTVEQEAKRPRLDDDSIHPDRRNSVNNAKSTAPPKGRERGRERRLFGAALGALSQNSATAAQKRRFEIEKRQLAQRRLQDEESEQRKLERQAKRKAQRWKEQKRLEQDSMRVRHDNLLATAHFLQTTTEPRLYYKPWETTPEEDDRIRDQIAEANETIRRDLNVYEHREEDAGRERDASREGQTDHTADASHSGKESNAKAPLEQTTANDGPTNSSERQPKDPEQDGDHADDFANKAVSEERAAVDAHSSNVTSHETVADEFSKEVDENGEEVVEATEDTVIY